jgi:hypothetical protein
VNQIDSKGAESLAEALKSNTTLIKFDLSCKLINQYNITVCHSIYLFIHSHTHTYHSTVNQICSKGAESLAKALKSNTTLIELDLGGE